MTTQAVRAATASDGMFHPDRNLTPGLLEFRDVFLRFRRVRIQRRVPSKRWDVTPLRNVDVDRIVLTGHQIVPLDRAAKAASLDPHDGVLLPETLVASEHLEGYRQAFQAVCSTSQRLLDDVAEEVGGTSNVWKSELVTMR